MKDVKLNVALDELKKKLKYGKNMEKIFTNEKRKNIIFSKKSLLSKKYKKIYEREELFMKETNKERGGVPMNERNDIIFKDLMKELNFIEKIFFKKKFIKVYKLGITFGVNNK